MSLTDSQSEVSFETKSSLQLPGKKKDISMVMKDIDAIASDAFLITTHRQERYESPTDSRATSPMPGPGPPGTGAWPGPGAGAGISPPGTGTDHRPLSFRSACSENTERSDDPNANNLNGYFNRMKTPPGVFEARLQAAAAKKADESIDKSPKPLTGLKKRWGKIRTAVSISSALDPDRAVKQFERALRLEPKTSKYLEGKRNSANVSKYALAPVRHFSSGGSDGAADEFMASVSMWKQETLQELFQTKNEPKRSVPVLSTAGAQAMYWEKQIVETVPKSGQMAPKHPTYHEVNTIRQNAESQRYKRRLQRSKF
jgi:hypothetical protein